MDQPNGRVQGHSKGIVVPTPIYMANCLFRPHPIHSGGNGENGCPQIRIFESFGNPLDFEVRPGPY
jgi:hypothetical protein